MPKTKTMAQALCLDHRLKQYSSLQGRRAVNRLDDVDFSWKVAGDFETNFLFANLRLAPNFHDHFSSG